MQEKFKIGPLGLPLTLSAVGTLATLLVGKKLHVGFGILWTILSVCHGWQHQQKMRADAARLVAGFSQEEREQTVLEALVDSFQVDAYLPGRIRLRSTMLAANPQWQLTVEAYVKSFTGVKKAEVNVLTGSLLILYNPEELRTKKKLAALEQAIAQKAGQRV